jgi:hypothetical protein
MDRPLSAERCRVRAMQRPAARSEGAAVVVLAIVLTVWAWWPMLVAYPSTATLDGRGFHQMIAIAKWQINHYHELPLWNPWECRGSALWDYPENITASPILLLLSRLDTTRTVIVWQLTHAAAGFVGMWLLARRDVRLSIGGAFVAAALFTYCAGHTTQYAGAHEALISFYDVPLLFFLWRRAEHDRKYAVGTGLALAWMVYDGATYPLPFTIVVLGIETIFRCTSIERARRVLGAAAIVGVVAFSVGASRLIPLVSQLSSHARKFDGYPDVDRLSWPALRDMYMLRSAGYLSRFHEQQYVFGEYLTYIGWLGVALAFAGLAVACVDAPWLVALAIATAILMAGHFASWAPWSVLHGHVFPFKSMRVPARFRLILLMPISLFVALAAERIPTWVGQYRPRMGRFLAAALFGAAVLVTGDSAGLGQDLIVPRFSGPPETPVATSPRFYYGGPGLTPDLIDQPRQNRAYLGCHFTWAFHEGAPVWVGDVPQVRAADPEAAVIEASGRTANTFTADVEVNRPTRLVFNSAFEPSWRSNVGVVVEHDQLLAIDVERTGRYRVKLHYWPRGLTAGFLLSALGLAFAIGYLVRRRSSST